MDYDPEAYAAGADGRDPLNAAFSDGVDSLKENFGLSLGLLIVSLVVGILFNVPARIFGSAEDPNAMYSLLNFVAWLGTTVMSAGVALAFVRIIRGELVSIGDVFKGFERPVPILVAAVLSYVIAGFGLILFVIPGIIAFLGLSFSSLLVLDQGYDGINALKASWSMMQGYKMSLFLLGFGTLLIMAVSAIPLGLGLIVTIPYSMLVYAAFYQRVLEANPPADSFENF